MIRFDRLLALADHLEKPQEDLFLDTFYFGDVYRDLSRSNWSVTVRGKDVSCGTLGCAMGELPGLFPEDWMVDGGAVRLRSRNSWMQSSGEQAGLFFGITDEARWWLFYPHDEAVDEYDGGPLFGGPLFGGKFLTRDATKEEVAANIRAFVSKMQEPGEAPKGVSGGAS